MPDTSSITWTIGPTQAQLPPVAAGKPLLGSALEMMADPLAFLVDQYAQLGPVFRVKAANRRFTVLAGPDANLFASQDGDKVLTGRKAWTAFADEIKADNFLAAIDGETHSALRKIIKKPYSRQAILGQLPAVIDTTRQTIQSWQPGHQFMVRDFMQRLVADQIGRITLGSGPGERFDDFVVFMRNILNAVLGQQPMFSLKFPKYRRSKERVMNMARSLIADHQANKDPNREPDLVDYFLAAVEENPELLSEGDLLIGVVGPYLAGIDTVAGTLSFMLYALLQQPETMARLQAEVDEAFADGPITPAQLRTMSVLYAAATETLRMYPVAPMVPRHVSQPFEFAGHRLETGDAVMMATGVAHFDPAVYTNPHLFDIDRCLPPRNEHRQRGVFSPYGFGSHTCAGAGMAEVQIMITMATLVHSLDLAMDPPEYQLKTTFNPSPMPDDHFRVRVMGRR